MDFSMLSRFFFNPLVLSWTSDPADPVGGGGGKNADDEDPADPEGEPEKEATPERLEMPEDWKPGKKAQAWLNQEFDARAERGSQAAQNKFLEAMGLEDQTPEEAAKAYKAALKSLQDIEDADKDEKTLLTEQVESLTSERDTANQERDQEKETNQAIRKQAAVLLEAMQPGHQIDPAAINDIWNFCDPEKITIRPDGQIKGVEKEVKAVLKERSYLVLAEAKPRGTPKRRYSITPVGAGGDGSGKKPPVQVRDPEKPERVDL